MLPLGPARRMAPIAPPIPSRESTREKCCRCTRETELQYNAMQIDAFVLLETARERSRAKVAGIEAKRNFWLASTALSVAMLGGGTLASDSDVVLAATGAGTTAE